jgi:phospholipid-binding lipoprotein MlaA
MTTTMLPRSWNRGLKVGAAGLCLVLTSACATDPFGDPRDPFEEVNRATYSFNELMDRMLFTPLAQGYNAVAPAPVNRGVTNFFNNLDDIGSAANNLLQLKVGRAISDVGRVAVNSTLGILGLFDVASNLNLPRYDEDFGQTLGVWGVDPGPYIVLPLIGPSTVRDGAGFAVDFFFDPVTYLEPESHRWYLWGLQVIDTRADLLSASRVLGEAALDPYSFVRDAYLQRRENLVHDGNPPD